MCLLLTNSALNLDDFQERQNLNEAWKRTKLQIQLATDQHAAMTEELENLAASDPKSFTQDQTWTLIRAIKVQSQILEMVRWVSIARGLNSLESQLPPPCLAPTQ